MQPPSNENDKSDDHERVEQKGVYEMLWDCRYCGTKQLLGKTHRFCPGCGAPQDANARYFPSEDQKIAVHDHVYVGVDKICSGCQSPNAGNAEFCGQCGAPLTDAARAKLQSAPQPIPAKSSQSPKPVPIVNPPERPKPVHSLKNDSKSDTGSSNRYKTPFIVVIITAIIGSVIAFFWTKDATLVLTAHHWERDITAIIGGAIAFFWTKDATIVLTAHHWEREVKIENFAPRTKADWCNQLPKDAYGISRASKVRSHQQVADGETCSHRNVDQGDGTFRQEEVCKPKYRNEPVYDEHCTYTIDRWEYLRSVTAKNRDKNPVWPSFQLANQEREGQRLATYFLSFKDQQAEKEFECAVAESLWQTAEHQSQWKIEMAALTGEEQCDTLQPLSNP